MKEIFGGKSLEADYIKHSLPDLINVAVFTIRYVFSGT